MAVSPFSLSWVESRFARGDTSVHFHVDGAESSIVKWIYWNFFEQFNCSYEITTGKTSRYTNCGVFSAYTRFLVVIWIHKLLCINWSQCTAQLISDLRLFMAGQMILFAIQKSLLRQTQQYRQFSLFLRFICPFTALLYIFSQHNMLFWPVVHLPIQLVPTDMLSLQTRQLASYVPCTRFQKISKAVQTFHFHDTFLTFGKLMIGCSTLLSRCITK